MDEVEQARKALGLNSDNFFLYAQSWGGILDIESSAKGSIFNIHIPK